jgi:NDP-sugar pyrophosphorylase family protein
MTLLCSEHADAPNRGEVVVEHGQLVRMQAARDAPPAAPSTALANVGVYLFSRDRVARSLTDAYEGASIERHLVNRLAASELVGVHSLGDVPVIDFGTPWGWQELLHADPAAFEILRAAKA